MYVLHSGLYVLGLDGEDTLTYPPLGKLVIFMSKSEVQELTCPYCTKGEGAYTDAKLYLKAENTLQSLREFLGER